jgi:hypothetical protein
VYSALYQSINQRTYAYRPDIQSCAMLTNDVS